MPIDKSQIQQLQAGIDSALSTIQTGLQAEVFAETLPFVGDKLKDVVNGQEALREVTELRTVLNTAFSVITSGSDFTESFVETTLGNALKNNGFATIAQVVDLVSVDENSFTVSFNTDKTAPIFSAALDSSFGLPGLGFVSTGSVDVALSYNLDFKAGVDSSGFYLDTSAPAEFQLGLDIKSPNFSIDTALGPLKFTAKDDTGDPSELQGAFSIDLVDGDGKLRADELSASPDMISAALTADADINLHLKASLGDGSAAFPSVSADLGIDWGFSSSTVGTGDNSGFGNTPTVTFSNVELDFGTLLEDFLLPVLEKIDAFFEPFDIVFDVLNADIAPLHIIPGWQNWVDTNHDGTISLLDLLQLAAPTNQIVGFFQFAADLREWTEYLQNHNSFDTAAPFNLGAFQINGDIRSGSFTLSDAGINLVVGAPTDQLQDYLGLLSGGSFSDPTGNGQQTGQDLIEQILTNTQISVPILTQPAQIFRALLGANADLLFVDLPKVQFGPFNVPLAPPLIVPVAIGDVYFALAGQLGFSADLSFGYDTRGLREYLQNNRSDLTDIFHGFYIGDLDSNGNDVPEIEASIGIQASVGADIFGVSLKGSGFIEGVLQLNLNDQFSANGLNQGAVDGKVYLDEFLGALNSNAFQLFDASGLIRAGLTASAYVGPLGVRYYSPTITLAKVNLSDDPHVVSNEPDVGLAENNFGHLELHIGGEANKRTLFSVDDNKDTAEVYTIESESDGSVSVEFLGRTMKYTGVTEVSGDSGQGDDQIAIDSDTTVGFTLTGGAGNDVFVGGGGDDDFSGGADDDYLDGGAGNDKLHGDDGNDLLIGGAGADEIDGGTDTLGDVASYKTSTQSITLDLTTPSNNSGDAIGDTFTGIEIYEGTEVSGAGDKMVGTSGVEIFVGLAGDDTLMGMDGSDVLIGGTGNDVLDGGTGDDILAGGVGDDTYVVDAIGDVVDDEHYGPGGGKDHVISSIDFSLNDPGLDDIEELELTGTAADGTGNGLGNLILGNGNSNHLQGLGGEDTLKGFAGIDWLQGGDANDTLEGGADNDLLEGDTGEDTLDGGSENDGLFGGADNDSLAGGSGDDLLDGGTGIDTLTGGAGNDIYYVDNAEDVIIEAGGEGSDTVRASVDFVLADDDDVETLTTVDDDGTDPIKLTGNGLAQSLIGNKGGNWLEGRGGADVIDGSEGFDTASYQHSPEGITVDFKAGTFQGGDVAGDTLVDIEAIEGADDFGDKISGTEGNDIIFKGLGGDDVLDGRGGIDHLFGGSGNDLLIGGDGGDELDGGSGVDTVDYSGAPATGLTADLTSSWNNTGQAAGDSYSSIENLVGTGGDDRLVGESGSNKLEGGDGDDVLQGNGSGDELIGGAGNDTASYQDSLSNGSAYAIATFFGVPDVGFSQFGEAAADYFGFSAEALYESGVAAVLGDASRNNGLGGFFGDSEAAGDTYDGIENLIGGAGNDVLFGDKDINVLDGGAGDDLLQGYGDGDHFIGGDDNKSFGGRGDTVTYYEATATVVADLASIAGDVVLDQAGDAEGDTFESVENLIGSDHDDVLRGDAGKNILSGGLGDDVLEGRGGADFLEGGADTSDLDPDKHNPGQNWASYEHAGSGVTADLRNNVYYLELLDIFFPFGNLTQPFAGTGDAAGDVYNHIVNLRGSRFDDFLHGDNGQGNGQVPADTSDGSNIIDGGKGDDILVGGFGNDHLIGGEGNDTASYFDSGPSSFNGNPNGVGVTVNLANPADSLNPNAGDTAAGDTYDGVENLTGSEYNDLLIGDAGDNVLTGDSGEDGQEPITILGDESDDILVGGAGADRLIGGRNGFVGDTASYFNAAEGVTVHLDVGADKTKSLDQNTGDAKGDTFDGIENLTGSAFADHLFGNSGGNVIDGGKNADPDAGDILEGGAGADTYRVRNVNDIIVDSANHFSLSTIVEVYVDGFTVNEAVDPYVVELIEGTTVTGNSKNNPLIAGNDEDNFIYGAEGDDQLVGGSGDDTLDGGVGSDTLDGGVGADKLVGGDGADFASYGNLFDGIIIDMENDAANSKAATGDAAGDTFDGVENVFGTMGDDIIRGDSGDNLLIASMFQVVDADELDGRDGDDTLIGGSGADKLIGGEGSDAASYGNANQGVTADLATPAANTGDASGDTYIGIENLVGSFLADNLRGDSEANVLSGGSGNDRLEGRDGDDTLYGESIDISSSGGDDTLIGGAGNDYLDGNAGKDVLEGGAGDDVLWGGAWSDLDTFIYNGVGKDVIGDFNEFGFSKNEIIKITGVYTTFQTLMTHYSVVGGAAVFDFGGGNTLTLQSIDKTKFTDKNFIFEIRGNDVQGTSGDDLIDNKTAPAGQLKTTDRGDTVHGDDGDDKLFGLAGDDQLFGEDGDDLLIGGVGADNLDGGSGIDTASYEGMTTGVTASLPDGTASNGADVDILVDIENLVGGVGGDRLTGDASDNVIEGGLGNDVLAGGGEVAGDTVSYAGSVAGVTVSLAIAVQQDTKGAGKDTIGGFENLTGGKGGDALTGDDGDNVIVGGEGNDLIGGGLGDDVLDGGAGSADTLSYAGVAADVTVDLSVTGQQDTVGAGLDTATGFENLTGGDGSDVLGGDGLANVLLGGLGDDVLSGVGGNDTITGGDGNDTIEGGAGDDKLTADGGTVAGSGTSDTASYASALAGVTVNLSLVVAQDTKGAGKDTLSGFENVTGSDFNDLLTGSLGANILSGGAGNDSLSGGAGDDTLNGGEDDDVFDGGLGNDALNGGLGIDTVNYVSVASGVTANLDTGQATYANAANLAGGKIDTDTLTGIENLVGGVGGDRLTGDASDNVIEGGLGNDVLAGGGEVAGDTVSYAGSVAGVTVSLAIAVQQDTKGAGKDTIGGFENLTGGKGGDALTGDDGDNVIVGGEGNDLIGGGLGDDVLDGGAGSADTLSYAGVAADVTVDLSVTGQQDTVGAGLDTATGFENLTGGDGSDVLGGDGLANVLLGGLGDDVLSGVGGNDTITGGDGNDTIEGGAGDDKLTADGGTVAGSGTSDTVSYASALAGVTVNLSLVVAQDTKGAGKDTLSGFENVTGSDFNDLLTGSLGANILSGGAGNDSLSGGAGDDTLNGGEDDDVFDGGLGNDALNGGLGIDTVNYVSVASGVTANLDTGEATYANAANLAGGKIDTDTLTGIENLVGGVGGDRLTGDASDNVIEGGLGNDVLAGGGEVAGDTVSYAGSVAGVTVSLAIAVQQDTKGAGKDTIGGFENLTGGKGGDALTGDDGDNVIVGGEGNDLIGGGLGDDVLDGGAGSADTLSYAGVAADVTVDLSVTGQQDTVGAGLDTATGFENLTGGDGSDVLGGDGLANVLLGGLGDDVLSGVGGNDTITGGDGNDTIEGGAGDDKLTADGGTVAGSGTSDTASYASALAGVTVNLSLVVAQDTKGAGKDTLSGFENVTGSDFNDLLTGSLGANILSGGAGNDSLSGGAGDDTLNGGEDDDVFDGGLGNDALNGGLGIDTVNYVSVASGVTANLDTGQATYANAANLAGGKIDTDTLTGIENLVGGVGGDRLTGDASDNVIEGGLGNDVLAGGGEVAGDTVSYAGSVAGVTVSLAIAVQQDTKGAGKDTIGGFENLTGGKGGDALTGDDGDNVIVGGEGNDLIGGGLGDDVLDGGAGSADTLSYAGVAADVTVDLSVTGQQDTVGAGLDTATGFENLTGGDGSDVLGGDGLANVLLGGLGDDVLSGVGGNDTITGGDGNDTIEGGAGDDKLTADGGTVAGSGTSDTASYASALAGVTVNLSLVVAQDTKGAGKDTLSGFENVTGSDFNDLLTGSLGANILSGGAGNDSLSGGAGDDTLNGGEDDDVFDGGLGNDALNGGLGIDTVNYVSVASGVTANLDTGQATYANAANLAGGKIDTDTLTGIENLVGGVGGDRLTGDASDNVIEGGLGNDVLAGGGEVAGDTVSYAGSVAGVTVSLAIAVQQDTKGAGKDTIGGFENLTGGKGGDALTGDDGDNVIVGGEGNDLIGGGLGDDVLDGGAGSADTLSYAGVAADVTVDLSVTGQQDTVGAGLDTATGFENLTGGDGSDVLGGDGLANVLLGGLGDDVLSGVGGNDTITGGDGNDTIEGGAGDDKLTADGGTVAGSGTSDTVSYASALAGVTVNLSLVVAQDTKGAGKDTLSGFENVTGSDFNDLLTGTSGNNIFAGGAGSDTVSYASALAGVTIDLGVGTAQDTKGAGIDTFSSIENLIGSKFIDKLTGGGNLNIIDGGVGNVADTLDGGNGFDLVSYASMTTAVTVDLTKQGGAQNTGTAGLDILSNFEGIEGGAGADKLVGNDDAVGNRLFGNGGNDTILGAGGGDVIVGGLGADILTGGAGADLFVFNSLDEKGDIIKDFGIDDFLRLNSAGFAGAVADTVNYAHGAGVSTFVPAAGSAGTGWLLYNDTDGKLYWDADGTGVAKATLLATIEGHPVLDAGQITISSEPVDPLHLLLV